MKILVIYFTDTGFELANKIKQNSDSDCGYELFDGRTKEGISTKDMLKKYFDIKGKIVFVGACGIAVRMIAAFIVDKLTDSPVVVIDEKGTNVIPILSGHVGGANELAVYLANILNATPIITTATDINNKFAVDIFAKENSLTIVNKEDIAKVSAKVLKNYKILIYIDDKISCFEEYRKNAEAYSKDVDIVYDKESADVVISNIPCENGMWLKPKEYIFGIGCKRGTSKEDIENYLLDKCQENNISINDIRAIVSIDVKKNETGIIEFCSKNDIPFITYTKKELLSVEGDFTGSSFVLEKVGVDNVCERAVAKYLGNRGKIIMKKNSFSGITLSIGYMHFREL